jgi:hypothetical protein
MQQWTFRKYKGYPKEGSTEKEKENDIFMTKMFIITTIKESSKLA